MLRSTSLFAKVGLLDPGVSEDLVRSAFGDLLARVEDGDPLAEAHHRSHDVLDHDDGDPAAVELEEDGEDVVDFGAGEPRHRFVRDEEPWAGRHRPRQLELAHLDLRQRGGWRVGLRRKAHPLEDAHRFVDDTVPVAATGVLDWDHEVLQHRHADEGFRNLEAACDAQSRPPVGREARDLLAGEHDPTRVGLERPADAIYERCLSRTVGTDETEALTLPDMEIDRAERLEAAEALGHVLHLEERLDSHVRHRAVTPLPSVGAPAAGRGPLSPRGPGLRTPPGSDPPGGG